MCENSSSVILDNHARYSRFKENLNICDSPAYLIEPLVILS